MSDTNGTEDLKWIRKINKVDREMVSNMEHMNNDELRELVLASEQNLIQNEREREANAQLERAKTRVATLEAPYKEAKEFQTAKVKFATLLLEQRGKA